jgi:Protein of unknown function (DUF3606)
VECVSKIRTGVVDFGSTALRMTGTSDGGYDLKCQKEMRMRSNHSKTVPADPTRIDLVEPADVQYWADKFDVSKERLSEAVRKVGHSAESVSRELIKGPR